MLRLNINLIKRQTTLSSYIKHQFNTIMDELINQINGNHLKIVEKIAELESKLETSRNEYGVQATKVLSKEEIQLERVRLTEENDTLKLQIKQLVTTLNNLEAKRQPNLSFVANGHFTTNQSKQELSDSKTEPVVEPAVEPAAKTAAEPATKPAEDNEHKVSEKKQKAVKKEPKSNTSNNEENKPIDVSRLDLRVGRILTAKRHPDADSLYVEEIDCGEDKPRTVVSGLVRFVPLEEMQNRLVVVMCNLKPAKMRGITSEAMVMCASTPDKVEILDVPEGSLPGDRVTFDKYPGTPDAQLNPKKKIWEQVAPDLKTNSECVATYKGEPFEIGSKGIVRAKSLANVQVK